MEIVTAINSSILIYLYGFSCFPVKAMIIFTGCQYIHIIDTNPSFLLSETFSMEYHSLNISNIWFTALRNWHFLMLHYMEWVTYNSSFWFCCILVLPPSLCFNDLEWPKARVMLINCLVYSQICSIMWKTETKSSCQERI